MHKGEHARPDGPLPSFCNYSGAVTVNSGKSGANLGNARGIPRLTVTAPLFTNAGTRAMRIPGRGGVQ